ncbi:hypothetical protein HXX76_001326 [Chlamydomonas incerta]|uniref:Uncharacterized protein n=1 Tax=Chlamydomonas incerta TaxID=51695 RepID=A0A835WBY0_CHLIN|nr:hypothetical protein HXX76_001326 [Chlamydomonas incerta]|eukprot:KAG2444581.1 hypothetical protein HXX76_001326 [Chlamydomonas incerta]
MSEVYVSWGKLVEVGWKVGGGLVIISQAFTAFQLEIARMKTQEDMKEVRDTIKAMGEAHGKDMKEVRDSITAMGESINAMNKKMEDVLPKKPR